MSVFLCQFLLMFPGLFFWLWTSWKPKAECASEVKTSDRMRATHWAAPEHQGALSETPLSFCPALVGNSQIPPGTCPSPLWESLFLGEAL